MCELRVFFTKTGRAQYISHLDVQRLFMRAFRRSGIRARYTEGYNPHIYMTFTLPLAINTESLCESMDFVCEEDTPCDLLLERLNAALPPDVRVTRIAPPVLSPKEIEYSCYDIRMSAAGVPGGELLRRFFLFLEQPQIVVEKKTKKGVTDTDIKPLFEVVKITSDSGDEVLLQLRCRAGNTVNLKPSAVTEAFAAYAGYDMLRVSVLRTAVLTKNLVEFQ